MHRTTLIRTLSHGYNSHNPYAVLTGFTGGNDRENYFAKPTDHPSMGAVCQYLGVTPATCQVTSACRPFPATARRCDVRDRTAVISAVATIR